MITIGKAENVSPRELAVDPLDGYSLFWPEPGTGIDVSNTNYDHFLFQVNDNDTQNLPLDEVVNDGRQFYLNSSFQLPVPMTEFSKDIMAEWDETDGYLIWEYYDEGGEALTDEEFPGQYCNIILVDQDDEIYTLKHSTYYANIYIYAEDLIWFYWQQFSDEPISWDDFRNNIDELNRLSLKYDAGNITEMQIYYRYFDA